MGNAAHLAAVCAAGLSPRLCGSLRALVPNPLASLFRYTFDEKNLAPVALPRRVSQEPLGSFTCSWWRQADDTLRLGMVQRIRSYATGAINGTVGESAFGYGAGLSDTHAMELLEGRCSTFHAGPFALYKLYGAAAPFAAMAP